MSVGVTTRTLDPFGLIVTVPEGTSWSELSAESVHAWVAEHRVVIVRGLQTFEKRDLPKAARRLGPLLAWSFGSVNELRVEPKTKNYLYTNREVPLHWDGAFVGTVPRYLFFHCLTAPRTTDGRSGGETVFVDTTRVWVDADDETKDRWRALRFVYATEKLTHYGGEFTSRVVGQHPYTAETVLRFAEPVDDLNPVTVTGGGMSPLESAHMITELRRALSAENAVFNHAWEDGDVVIADNHALLHGRRAFVGSERRHIRRVNVCGPERTWKDAVMDAVRIRRPEFMVAEIPILLIPALLVASPRELATPRFAEIAATFVLLFHFGDMINCLADRDLDAVYKTHLSESIYGLGVRNVKWQLGLTVLGALGLASHLAWSTGRIELLPLVCFGLLLGAEYSVGPLRLKGRGAWQVATLWAVIFVGPMLFVMRSESSVVAYPLLFLVAAYGAMQEAVILVNTAEDLPEDDADGIRTTAVALGLPACMALATCMVGLGGLTAIVLFGWLATASARDPVWAVLPLAGAWVWVTIELAIVWSRVRQRSLVEAIAELRPRARRMPIWITATAWTSLWAAAYVGAAWTRQGSAP